MLSLHTNAAALSTQNALGGTQKALTTSMSRLGTGFRINSAMDDAAGLQIATRLNAQSRGMAVAQRNVQNGISMLQTAEGALTEVSNIMLRMKDLATQAADGTTSAADRTAMQGEFKELSNELVNIMGNTSFGGEALLKDTTGKLAADVVFQIGSASGEKMTFATATSGFAAVNTAVNTTLNAVDISTTTAANTAIDTVNTALGNVGTFRSSLGAAANRLDHVYNNLANMRTNTEQSKGRIMDVDYASETANMTTKQMLMQASTSMLKQSGSMSQLVMSLMQ